MKQRSGTYNEAVAELSATPFQEVVEIMDGLIRSGEGGCIYFQPGDATRYSIIVEGGRTFTVSNGEPMSIGRIPVGSTHVSFGTIGQMHRQPIGRLSEIYPGHPWTAAVWRRLSTMLALKSEAWR